jgi:hypothetical protein
MGEAGTGLLSGLFGTRSGSGGGFIDILTGLASDLGYGQEEEENTGVAPGGF